AHRLYLGNAGVGHLALGAQVPVVVPFAGAAHVFREDVDLQRHQPAVALAHGGGADVLAAGDVGDARPGDAHDREVVRHLHAHALAVVGLDGQHLAVEFLHRAANPDGRVGGGLGEGNGRNGG